MNHSVEKLEGSMAKLTFEVTPEQFEAAIQKVYNKAKNSIQIQGFRKGHAPLALVERVYGKGVFYEDALNEVLPDLYKTAVEEEKLEVMSRPDVSVGEIKDGQNITVTCQMAIKPEVTLGDYTSLKKKSVDTTVSDEDVDNEIKSQAKRNARKVEVTDRPAQLDDTVTIDFEGSVDGKPFDGGKGSDYQLKLGSHSFIDTFEDQLVGKNTGDDVTVNVTFPEDYGQKDLAGKPAEFKVKIKKITYDDVPEINDDFAKDVSECQTLDEYKEKTRKTLQDRKDRDAKAQVRDDLLDQLVASSTMDMPEPMVDEQVDQMINEYAQTLRYQGMDINKYFSMTNTNMDQLKQEVKPDAVKRLKENLVLDALAVKENVEVTDDDIQKELEDMAKGYGMEVDKLKDMMGQAEIDNMKAGMINEKALDKLVELAKD